MPGRLVIYDDASFKKNVLNELGTFNDLTKELTPQYNLPPTRPLPALLNNGTYLYTHFGLIPNWAKDRSAMQVNARSENLFERVSFTDAFRYRRCLIPINGWYEWEEKGAKKQPYYIHAKDDENYALAGIWDSWIDPQTKEAITSVALITTEPNNLIKKIHHRMPVIVERIDWKLWMDETTDNKALFLLLRPFEDKEMGMQKVSPKINSVRFNEVSCLDKDFEIKGQGQLF